MSANVDQDSNPAPYQFSSSTPQQKSSGIRMPDRTPVGWLPLEARKKKGHHRKFAL